MNERKVIGRWDEKIEKVIISTLLSVNYGMTLQKTKCRSDVEETVIRNKKQDKILLQRE